MPQTSSVSEGSSLPAAPQRKISNPSCDTSKLVWSCTIDWYGYGSIPINTFFSWMNIHLPAILMFTRGTGFWPIPIWIDGTWSEIVGFAFQTKNMDFPSHTWKSTPHCYRCWAKVNLTNAEAVEYLNFNRPSVVQEFLRYFPCSAYSSIELDCYCSSSLGGGPGGNCT